MHDWWSPKGSERENYLLLSFKDIIRRLNEFKAQEIMLRGLNQAFKKNQDKLFSQQFQARISFNAL